jgi:2-polyprenyl-3-methyl-5-hydroxy-6-metoxy-1,4-benzoquinol methylase
MVDELFQKQQFIYDETWKRGISAGKEQRGNLGVNLDFLNQCGLIMSGRRTLEVGCGIGSVTNELHNQGCEVVGTDISNSAIEYGRKKYADVELKVGVAEMLEFDDASFDIVLSFDVLEHLEDVDGHLNEVARVLVDGGFYLLQTPNKYFNSVYETVKSKSMGWKRYHPSLHTAGQIKRRFRKNGFDVKFIKMNTFNDYALRKLRYRWLKKIAGWLDFRKLPLFLQTNFYVVATKRTSLS